MSNGLAESLHNLVDAEAIRLHDRIDEVLARHASPRAVVGRICVDPGHGGHDPGARAGEAAEKDLVLEYGLELRRALAGRGHRIRITRAEDRFIPLTARAELSNAMAADCFVSLHANFSSSETAEGAWIIFSEGSRMGEALAREIFAELAAVPGVLDQDPEEEVYPDASPWVGGRRLTVLRKTWAPAVLIELGFLTNAADRRQLGDPAERARICRAIADGVETWLNRR